MNDGRKTCDKCGGTNVDCGRAESRAVHCFNVLSEKHKRAVIDSFDRAEALAIGAWRRRNPEIGAPDLAAGAS